LLRAHPDIDMRVHVSDRAVNLLEERVDSAICVSTHLASLLLQESTGGVR